MNAIRRSGILPRLTDSIAASIDSRLEAAPTMLATVIGYYDRIWTISIT